MIVAELQITTGNFSTQSVLHRISFADLARAEAEYERISKLILAEETRTNDKPPTIEVVGDGNRMTCPLREVRSVGLADYARANEQEAGVRDAFPNLFKK